MYRGFPLAKTWIPGGRFRLAETVNNFNVFLPLIHIWLPSFPFLQQVVTAHHRCLLMYCGYFQY
jgi:hypothetical protein